MFQSLGFGLLLSVYNYLLNNIAGWRRGISEGTARILNRLSLFVYIYLLIL